MDSWRLIRRDLGTRVPSSRSVLELYDLGQDPREQHDLARSPAAASALRRMVQQLDQLEDRLAAVSQPSRPSHLRALPETTSAPSAGELARLRNRLGALGYLASAAPRSEHDGIDPRDGIALLASVDAARHLLASEAGSGKDPADRAQRALALLVPLARRNPSNLPLLTQLIDAQLLAGRGREGLETAQRAVDLAPDLHFVHLRLAAVYEQLDRLEDADHAYRRVLELNPRSYEATLALAQRAVSRGAHAEELDLLEAAFASGLQSTELERRAAELRRFPR